MTPFALDPADAPALWVLAAVTILYTLFHYGAAAEQLLRRAGASADDDDAQAKAVVAQRLAGAALLGLVPVLLILFVLPGDLSDYGIGPTRIDGTLGFCAFVAVVIWPIVYRQQRKSVSWDEYPQIRAPEWDRRRLAVNIVTWTTYLLGYELFFRGFFLFAMARWVGPVGAVAITTLVYVMVHLPKPAPETMGTIPMGVVFAVVTLWTGGIWAAFLGHAMIACWSDYWAMRANPEFTWKG